MKDHPDRLPTGALEFLADLEAHNDKAWFEEHRSRCAEELLEPSRRLVRTLVVGLGRPFSDLVGSAAKSGGSLTRMHRDLRFSRSKEPYYTSIEMHFWHGAGKRQEAPGLFLRVDPREAWVGAGLRRPDRESLRKIRAAIDADQRGWRRAVKGPASVGQWVDSDGERSRRVPAPWDAEHPCAGDLRRRSFTASARLPARRAVRQGFAGEVIERWIAARPLLRFLCKALELPV